MRLKKSIENILRKETYKNVIILFTGSSIAQIIPILATLVLTRIFTKEHFGIFFIYSSLGIIISSFISFKLELSIILPKKNEAGKLLFISSLLTTILLSIIIFLVIVLFSGQINTILGDKGIGELTYLLPLSLLFLGIIQSCSFWFNRNDKYKDNSIINIIKSTTSSILQLLFGFVAFFQNGLVMGLIGGQFISSLVALFYSFKGEMIKAGEISISKMVNLIKKYKSIPIYNTGIGITNTLSNQLPIFLLTGFYNLEMAAFYGLSNRIVSTPMGLIGQSVGQVLYSEAAKRFNLGESLHNIVVSTYKKLAKLAMIPFIILLFAAIPIFSLLFGVDWKIAGAFTQLLVPWLFLMFLNSPMTYILIILDKQKALFIYDILLLTFRFLALFFGYKYYNNVYYSIGLFSFVGIVFNLFLLFYILKISKNEINNETD